MKKALATLLAFAMIVTGFLCLNPNASEVKAATTATEGNYKAVAKADWQDKDEDGVPELVGYLFAGFYKSEECTMANRASKSNATHAKFVKEDMLDVKIQVTNGVVQKSDVENEDGEKIYEGKHVIRFVSSVDSLNYNKIGFELEYTDADGNVKTLRNTTKKVFKRIESTTGATDGSIDEYEFSPKVVGEDSEYFMTAKLPVEVGNEDDTYKVRAFWVTMDGTEVMGETRSVSVNDSANDVVNMTVQADSQLAVGTGYTATYGPNAEGTGATATTVEVLSSSASGHTTLRVTLADGDTATGLKSATKFVISKDGTAVAYPIYRNYYTDVAGTADTSWWDVDPTATRFEIASVSDLYGLASIVNGKKDLFYQNEIHLVRSVEVNDGIAIPASETNDGVAKWQSDTTPVAWTPIGSGWNADFRGIFEGDNNTISGLYISGGSSFVGLFGYAGLNTGQSAEVRNVRLTNSYFETSYASGVGSIISYGYQAKCVENVYSDAILCATSSSAVVGGLIGSVRPAEQTIKDGSGNIVKPAQANFWVKNSWFDGEINAPDTGSVRIGGIMGTLNNTLRLDLVNCLYTGTINCASSNASVGSFFGRNINAIYVCMQNCLSTGEFNTAGASKTGMFGEFQEAHAANGYIEIENSYTTQQKAWGTNPYPEYVEADCLKGVAQLAVADVNTLFSGHNGAWVNDVEDAQTPILSSFASWWNEKQYEAGLDTSWYDADATEYVISTAKQLNGLAELAKTNTFAGKTIKLGANIALNKADSTTVQKWVYGSAIADNMWTPIGTSSSAFAGTFDGQGYAISGLYLSSTEVGAGLFGYTADTAVFKNFKFVDSYITSTRDGVGMIGQGSFELMESVYTNAVIKTSGGKAGGFVGVIVPRGVTESLPQNTQYNIAFKNCWFDGEVESASANAGGFVGTESAAAGILFANCLSTGTVNASFRAGGFYGWKNAYAWHEFHNCLSIANTTVTDTSTYASYWGAYYGDHNTSTYNLKVYNTYGVGKNVGHYSSGTAFEAADYLKTRDELIHGNESTLFPALTDMGETDNAWVSDGATGWNNTDRGTPILATFAEWWIANVKHDELTIDFSWYNDSDTEFTLYDAADLNGLAYIANNTDDFTGKTVKLGANIELNEVDEDILASWKTETKIGENWTPIGTSSSAFAGTFDGQGYAIRGLYLSSTEVGAGLFGYTADTAVLKNFKFVDSYIASTRDAVGMIGQGSFELMESVYTNAVIKTSGGKAGGFVGVIVPRGVTESLPQNTQYNIAFKNCWFDGEVESASANAGGFVGTESAAAGILFANCLSTGSIKASMRAGGFYGWKNAYAWHEFHNCLSIANTTVTDTSTYASYWGAYYGDHNTSTYNLKVYNTYGVGKNVGHYSSGTAFEAADYLKTRDELIHGDESTLFPALTDMGETDNAWVNDIGYNDTDRGTPILANFAEWWLERNPASGLLTRADITWYDADETEFTLTTAEQLYGLAQLAKTNTFADKTVKLGANITLNEVDETILAKWQSGSAMANKNWTPIGTTDSKFSGIFDGQGYEISGLYHVSTMTTGAGLFGNVAYDAQIKNFKLVDAYISASGNVGMIGEGLISKVEKVYSNAIIESNNHYAGGMLGFYTGYHTEKGVDWTVGMMTFEQCWFDGVINMTGTAQRAGGIVGGQSQRSRVDITNCLYTGHISAESATSARLGGLFGWANSTAQYNFTNCLAVGSFEAEADTGYIGGFVGQLGNNTLTLTNCYTTNTDGVAVGIGNVGSYAATYVDTSVMTREDLYLTDLATLFPGSTAWVQDTGYNDIDRGTPILATFAEWWIARQDEGALEVAPSVAWYTEPEVAGEYVIENKGDLLGFLSLSKQGETFDGETIKLGANITLNTPNVNDWKVGKNLPAYQWIPVTFNGNFDGQGHSISGIYVKSNSAAVGFFGKTAAGSSISNFRLLDSYVEQSYASGTWSHFTGSIVGDAAGDITNVYSNATMVSPCHYTSGIVGIIRPASVEGETVAINNCWFDGTIELTKEVGYIGGIVGYQENGTLNLTNVLYTGHIKGNRPTADKYGIGGIIGQTYNTVTATNLESVVSAGTFDIPNGTSMIGSVVGYFYSGVDETDTSTYTLNNVFANREWGTAVSWGGGNGTLTGQVVQTADNDRLVGYVAQVARDIKNDVVLDSQKLDFTSAWTMRTNDVPVPTALKDVVDVRTIVTDATMATLTNELALGTIGGNLANAVAEGAGDYLVTVAGTKSNYDGYLSQLKTLGFTKYADNAGTTMEADGIYSATYTKAATDNVGEWVVNVTFVTNDGKLYVSINSDVDSVAKTLLNDDTKNPIGVENGTNAVSLSMVEDKEAVNITGNCFVFQLPNGHFIINDGNTDDGAGAILKAYLQSQVGEGNPIIIDAWTISHFHNDHAGALMDFAKDASLRENVYLNALYANEPSAYGATIYETRTVGDINSTIQGAKLLTKSPTDNSAPDFYEVHMGQRYYFNGVTMDVVNTPEQIPVDTWTGGEKTVETHTPDPFNTSSVSFVFTLSESGKRVLLGGDSTKITMQYVIDAYGTNNNTLANINVFAAYHHGKNAMNQYNFNNGSALYPTSNQDGYVNAGKANNGWAEFLLNNTKNSSNKFDVMLFPFVKKFSTYKHTSASEDDYYLGQYKNVYVGDDGSVIYPWNIGEINKYYADNSNLHLTTGYEDSTSATEANPHGTVKITFNADGQISHTVYNTVHGQETYTFETFVPTSGDGTVVPDEEL